VGYRRCSGRKYEKIRPEMRRQSAGVVRLTLTLVLALAVTPAAAHASARPRARFVPQSRDSVISSEPTRNGGPPEATGGIPVAQQAAQQGVGPAKPTTKGSRAILIWLLIFAGVLVGATVDVAFQRRKLLWRKERARPSAARVAAAETQTPIADATTLASPAAPAAGAPSALAAEEEVRPGFAELEAEAARDEQRLETLRAGYRGVTSEVEVLVRRLEATTRALDERSTGG
jgi:hypothetical protein